MSASALLAGCSLISPPPKISPQEHLGDAGRGHRLARGLCASCHAVEGAGPSPNAAAPPFGVVARRYANIRLDWELETISQAGHYAMPAKPLTPVQRQDLDAYLRGLSSLRATRK